MGIRRTYQEAELKQFLDGKEQSMETFEKEVIDALRRFVTAYHDKISECLLTADSKGIYVTMVSTKTERDEDLIDAQSELDFAFAESGWPEIQLFAAPACVDAEDFTVFSINSLHGNE